MYSINFMCYPLVDKFTVGYVYIHDIFFCERVKPRPEPRVIRGILSYRKRGHEKRWRVRITERVRKKFRAFKPEGWHGEIECRKKNNREKNRDILTHREQIFVQWDEKKMKLCGFNCCTALGRFTRGNS